MMEIAAQIPNLAVGTEAGEVLQCGSDWDYIWILREFQQRNPRLSLGFSTALPRSLQSALAFLARLPFAESPCLTPQAASVT